VFVSSSMEELEDERQTIRKVITQIPKFEPAMFEDFGARTEASRKACVEKVEKSDIYLGIFYDRFSEPTAEEYYEAVKLGKDILIYIKEPKKREERLSSFIEELKRKHIISEFRNVVDLEERVRDDLLGVVTREYLKTQSQRMKKQDIAENDKVKIRLALNYLCSINLVDSFMGKKGRSYKVTAKFLGMLAANIVKEFEEVIIKKGKKFEDTKLDDMEMLFAGAIVISILREAKQAIEKHVLAIYVTVLSGLVVGTKSKEKFLIDLKKGLMRASDISSH